MQLSKKNESVINRVYIVKCDLDSGLPITKEKLLFEQNNQVLKSQAVKLSKLSKLSKFKFDKVVFGEKLSEYISHFKPRVAEEDNKCSYEILHLTLSNRHSIRFQILKHGYISIKAPINLSEEQIFRAINDKGAWIIHHLEQAKIKSAKKDTVASLKHGRLMYLGQSYPIVYNYKVKTLFAFFDGSFYTSYSKDDDFKIYVIRWYKSYAKKYLVHRTEVLAKQYKFEYKSVKINSARTRWGSCSVKNDINYTWKLIQAPESVIDYLIIHELVHTKVKNHSTEFWRNVSNIYPEYKKAEKWLKENNYLIEFE